ncbi:unnamed protein product [Periconia digitata]|uniref:Uncharacterized protein n=1 Tax=Periconia digitata TaxID=1303443 RepID=A0A9W4ULA4_9PLEO|nr:unnamed protein product [Periconia digitata]
MWKRIKKRGGKEARKRNTPSLIARKQNFSIKAGPHLTLRTLSNPLLTPGNVTGFQ